MYESQVHAALTEARDPVYPRLHLGDESLPVLLQQLAAAVDSQMAPPSEEEIRAEYADEEIRTAGGIRHVQESERVARALEEAMTRILEAGYRVGYECGTEDASEPDPMTFEFSLDRNQLREFVTQALVDRLGAIITPAD